MSSYRLAQFLAVATLTWDRSARADDVADIEAILRDPVISTPSASSELASTAPGTSTSISAEELRVHGIRSLDEAINYASLGMMAGHNMHSAEVGARGVLVHGDYGNHVLLLVNGVPQNEPWDGTAYFDRGAGIPFELVDHIEIMLGPGSVVYGSQAMLGVINIVTKRARDYQGLHLVTESELASPLGNGYSIRTPSTANYGDDLGKGARLAFGYGKEFRLFGVPSELTLQLEYYRFKGAAIEFANQDYGNDSVTGMPKNFGGSQAPGIWGGKATHSWYTRVPTSYARMSVGEFTLTARAGTYTRSAPYNDYLTRTVGDFDPANDYERDTFYDLSLRHEKILSSVVTLSSQLYAASNRYRWYESSSAAEDCAEWQTTGCKLDLLGIGRRLGGDSKLVFDWHDALHMSTVLGGAIQVRNVYSTVVARSPLGNGHPQAAIDTVDAMGAVHLQQLLRPVRQLDINAGARLDIDQRFGSRLSPRAAVALNTWPGGTWKTSYSEAFRAPTAYELHFTDRVTQVTATSLGPEITRTVELSFEQRVAAHRLFFGVYRSWWNDMVYLAALSPDDAANAIGAGSLLPTASEAYQYRNLSRIDNWGCNAAYGLALFERRVRFDVNLTGARTRIVEGGMQEHLPVSAPQFFGNARVSVDPGAQLPTIGIASVFRSRTISDRYYDGGFSRPPTAPQSWEFRLTL
ncbi:MAG TPA: TonB-dependent receptor, partial [Polyangiaceae bacterium]